MGRAYRQFPRRRGPVLPLASAPQVVPTGWQEPVSQPSIHYHKKRLARQQPQRYGDFWAKNQSFIVPSLLTWMQPVNQPVRGKKRQQVNKIGVFTAALTVTPVVPTGWQRPVNQPFIKKKRQQPPTVPVFWAQNKAFVPPQNGFIQAVNQTLKSRVPKRQQPQRYGNPFYDIPPQAVPVLNAWVQPVNQPLRNSRLRRQRQMPLSYKRVFFATTAPASAAPPLIFLLDGRLALKVSGKVYLPL